MAGWITINGAHIYVKDGEDVAAAFERTTGQKLSGTGNPEQRADAKKFSINDALSKAAEERDKKSMRAINKAQRTGDRDEMLRQEGVLKDHADEEIESKNLTEKGKEARKDREAKAKEDIKKDAAKERTMDQVKKEYREALEKRDTLGNIADGRFSVGGMDDDEKRIAEEVTGLSIDDLKDEEKVKAAYEKAKEEKAKLGAELNHLGARSRIASLTNVKATKDMLEHFESIGGAVTESDEKAFKAKYGSKIVNETIDFWQRGGNSSDITEEDLKNSSSVNDNIRAAAGRTSPKLGAPERGNILSVGTYKGYSIDKDIFGGKGVTVNAFGEELVFKSVEEAMKEIDTFKKK